MESMMMGMIGEEMGSFKQTVIFCSLRLCATNIFWSAFDGNG